MTDSWSTSDEPDLACALGRRKTAQDCQGKILYTKLLYINLLLSGVAVMTETAETAQTVKAVTVASLFCAL